MINNNDNLENETDFSQYDIDKKWQKKFKLIEKIGADDGYMQFSKNLSKEDFKTRLSIIFNVWAFLFSVFYYFYKKMYYKGAFLIGISIVWGIALDVIAIAFDIKFSITIYSLFVMVLAATMANYDYYRFITKGEKIWNFLPNIFADIKGAIAFPMVAILLSLLIGSDSVQVDMVKNGVLKSCPSATVEKMVDSFIGSPSWEYGKSASGKEFVNISGDIAFNNKEAKGLLQFTINTKNNSFNYKAFEINDIPQNKLIALGLLKKMCNSTK